VLSGTELREMLKLQIKMGAVDANEGEEAQKIAEGAMCFRDKTVEEVMTPVNDAYFLPAETSLGFQTIKDIFEQGYSRVPVYKKERNDYIGMLHTKDLMFADPEDEMKLGEFIKIFGRKADTFWQEDKLPEVLRRFKSGGAHMGIVRKPIIDSDVNPTYEIVGVITLEDVMEEILQDEIIDEHDVYVDVDNRIKVKGRETKKGEVALQLLDPRWRRKNERLAAEEVNVVKRHLSRGVFGDESNFSLSMRATEWLVLKSKVENRVRATSIQITVPKKEDWLFFQGVQAKTCVLVLQGRLTVIAGRERFKTEVGAFSLVGREALRVGDFVPDFDAWLGTDKVRILIMEKDDFLTARQLDKDHDALEQAMRELNMGQLSKKDEKSRRSIGVRLSTALACPLSLVCSLGRQPRTPGTPSQSRFVHGNGGQSQSGFSQNGFSQNGLSQTTHDVENAGGS
jgi:metal transporter CNNM